MSKTNTLPKILAVGTGMTFLLYLALQLLLALLAVRGMVPEGRLTALQVGTAALAVLPGGAYAARRAGLGALWGALAVAGLFAGLTALLGLLCFDRISVEPGTWMRLAGMGAGSLLAGVLCAGKGKKKKRSARKKK